MRLRLRGQRLAGSRESVDARRTCTPGLCVNCRYQATHSNETPSFKGDRILVMMFPYDLPFLPGSGPPERWDVVVFRYPEEPEVSYIKRLVGLPGETIRIYHGDVYVKPPGSDTFTLARKPMRHQAAMQINVYDDRHQPRALAEQGRVAALAERSPAGSVDDRGTSRYRSGRRRRRSVGRAALPPSRPRSRAMGSDPEGPRPCRDPPRATLITDFYSYNTNMPAGRGPREQAVSGPAECWMQPHWVGDLTLEAYRRGDQVDAGRLGPVRADQGGPAPSLHDRPGDRDGRRDPGRGRAGRWQTPIKGPGRYQVEFANVDDRMTLVVDGRAVGGDGIVYESSEAVPIPTAADLAPAAVSVRDAAVA